MMKEHANEPIRANDHRQTPIIPNDEPPLSGSPSIWRLLLGIIGTLVILGLGGQFTWHLIETGPKAERQPPPRRPRPVQTEVVHATRFQTRIQAMGTVVPARTIQLYPRVGGQIVTIDVRLEPGGVFKAGETVLQIDKSDYELALVQCESDLAQREAELRLEEGQQSIAQREYELLGEEIHEEDRDLVLRQPQLSIIQARIEAARAACDQARLDLQRTTVKAPFNALVMERRADVGSQVSPSTSLAELVGTDEFWVEASVPVDQLKWIRFPQAPGKRGSKVRIYNDAAWGETVFREGYVARLAGDLEESGRMARLIIAVPVPLGGDSPDNPPAPPRLLLDSYVRTVIDGQALEDVIPVDRTYVHNNRQVWVVQENRLSIREVEVVFRDRDNLLIQNGLQSGEEIVISELPAPVEGMLLERVAPQTTELSDAALLERDATTQTEAEPRENRP